MVVGSQARILYSDQEGRVRLALAFNQAVRTSHLKVNQNCCLLANLNSIFNHICPEIHIKSISTLFE